MVSRTAIIFNVSFMFCYIFAVYMIFCVCCLYHLTRTMTFPIYTSLHVGDHLRNAVTSRFASNMVFMSLLLGTEIGVLFSPSQPADVFRAALKNESYSDANFWAAIMLCISIGFTLSTLVANFTAWAIIGAVSPQNSHAILRSSIGLDAAQLPARLVILSIYCFLVWVILFIYILVPHIWGIVIASFPVVLIAYIVIMYSSFGRLVIYSRAMQQKEIFKDEEDDNMSSKRLFEELLKLAEKEKHKKAPLPLYYRSKTELQRQLCALRSQSQDSDSGFESVHASHYLSQILSSSGHFDDKSLPGIADLETMEEEADEENSLPQSTNPDEGEDGMSSLRPRSGMRRGYSDPSSQASRLRGASSRSLLQNSPGASTMPMTLTG